MSRAARRNIMKRDLMALKSVKNIFGGKFFCCYAIAITWMVASWKRKWVIEKCLFSRFIFESHPVTKPVINIINCVTLYMLWMWTKHVSKYMWATTIVNWKYWWSTMNDHVDIKLEYLTRTLRLLLRHF